MATTQPMPSGMGGFTEQEHLSVIAISPLIRAQRQKARHRGRWAYDFDHRVSHAQESPAVSRSRGRLLRPPQRRAAQTRADCRLERLGLQVTVQSPACPPSTIQQLEAYFRGRALIF